MGDEETEGGIMLRLTRAETAALSNKQAVVLLRRIKEEYEKNFDVLWNTSDKEERRQAGKRERMLNRMDILLLKKLGRYISDPCADVGSNPVCEPYSERIDKNGNIEKTGCPHMTEKWYCLRFKMYFRTKKGEKKNVQIPMDQEARKTQRK